MSLSYVLKGNMHQHYCSLKDNPKPRNKLKWDIPIYRIYTVQVLWCDTSRVDDASF